MAIRNCCMPACMYVGCCYVQELCLHTKLLAPVNMLIADFLAKAPDPPAFLLTRNAVHILKVFNSSFQSSIFTARQHSLLCRTLY